ncbi:MAG TPA: hypothetical protein VGR07_13335 [Thermoanaerobaculia bacterium]|jgi:hypothetical protein|nr:hypothetical protein [Thermoanaerobaculia bacterium]
MQRLKRALALSAAALLALSPLAGCAAYRYQHAPEPARKAQAAQEVPVKPAAPEFKRLRSDAQAAQVRGEAEETKDNLAAQGHYSCCIKPACNECLLRRGECHCRDMVMKDSPCGECTQAWIDGRGAVDGVNPIDLLKRKEVAAEQEKASKPPQP